MLCATPRSASISIPQIKKPDRFPYPEEVEFVLLGPTNDRRQLQDSPILGDVWIEFAKKPTMPMDLLITPDRERLAGPVAVLIADLIARMNLPRRGDVGSKLNYTLYKLPQRNLVEKVNAKGIGLTQL